MRHLVPIAILSLIVVAGCHHYGYTPKTHVEMPEVMLRPMCDLLPCDHVFKITSTCNVTDTDGNSVTQIEAEVGDRICFLNDSGCPVVLLFDDELFGQNRARVSLAVGECTNLSVNDEARGHEYVPDFVCQCTEGHGHGNPGIIIGGGGGGGD